MRSLLAVLIVAAATAQAAAGAQQPKTIYVRPHGEITAFAQDGQLIAWFAPGWSNGCNAVHVLAPANGLHLSLPEQAGESRNVTCRWAVASDTPVRLALAYTPESSSVLWTLREQSPLPFDYLLGAGLRDKKERRFQEIAHANKGPGLWLGGIAGDGKTLAYGVTSVAYVDEVGCLAGTGSCAKKIGGGGVYRLVGRQPPHLVPGTSAAVAVAASGDAIAYVPASAVAADGTPIATPEQAIEVVRATGGELIAEAVPANEPVAVALTPHNLVTLERSAHGQAVVCYSLATGAPRWSVPVPGATAPELTATDRLVVVHAGRTILGVEMATHRARTLAKAAASPIGLSLDGTRLAWAENLKGRGRIRALALRG